MTFFEEEPYNGFAPCPHCFESSGYMARTVPNSWAEPGWEEPDPTRRCEHCLGTGSVEATPIDLDDLAEMAGEADPCEGSEHQMGVAAE